MNKSSDIAFIKENGRILPADHETNEYIESLKEGEGFIAKRPQKQRNMKFHRKFFAMLRTVYDGCGINFSFLEFRKSTLITAGFIEIERLFIDKKLIERVQAQSIAVGNMNPKEFEEVYSKSLDVCIETYNLEAETLHEFI